MNRFLRLSIQYWILLLTIIFLLDIYTSSIIRNKADFKLKENPEFLILGHSHPECAFDDSEINSSVNLSDSGEAYFYTYFKIRKVLNQNPSINYVFLEFTNNQITEYMNEWIWGDNSIHKSSLYTPFMSFSDKTVLLKNNPLNYFNILSISNQDKINRICKQKFNYRSKAGGFLHLVRNKTDSLLLEKEKDGPLYRNKILSNTNIEYLDKIIEFCKKKNKKVFFIRSPVHERYVGYLNENEYQNIRKNKYPKIEYLDFSKYPLENYEFGDLEHLNHIGAKKFSKWFNKVLSKGLLEIKNKQDFINAELKAYKTI